MINEFTLSKNELEIMKLFWAEDRPLSKSDIVNLSVNKSWKESSIYILLKSLLKKGAIEEHGFFKSQTNIGRTFAAALTENEYAIMQINMNRKSSSLSLVELVSGLIEQETDTSILDELESIIKNKHKS